VRGGGSVRFSTHNQDGSPTYEVYVE